MQQTLDTPGTYSCAIVAARSKLLRDKERVHEYRLEVLRGPAKGQLLRVELSLLPGCMKTYQSFLQSLGELAQSAATLKELVGLRLRVKCEIDRYTGKLVATKFLPLTGK